MAVLIRHSRLRALLEAIDPTGEMYLHVRNPTELEVCSFPGRASHIVDLAEERVFGIPEVDSRRDRATHAQEADTKVQRELPSEGRWIRHIEFKVCGNPVTALSIRSLLLRSLYCIERQVPGTLDKLSLVKKRTKRIVARKRELLFEDPRLAQRYSADLGNGFFVGTNNSEIETKRWLERAVSLADLKWGEDYKVSIWPDAARP